jgi:hypothetical protein
MRDDEHDRRLAELLDGSFGSGPGLLPSPVERLAIGRQARRRRRRVVVAGAAAAMLVVVGTGSALSRGDGADQGRSLEPATGPPSSGPSPTDQTVPERLDQLQREARALARRLDQRLVSAQFPASFAPDGRIVVRDGWRITQRVEEPVGYQPPEASLGVVVTDGTATRWMLLTLARQTDAPGDPVDGLGSGVSAVDPGDGYSRFEDWLASVVAINGGPESPPLVVVDAQDRLQPGPGASLVEVRAAPVIAGYTTADDRLAEVRLDGRAWFVVVRGHGAGADLVTVDAAVLPEPTFDGLVAHLTAQVDSGEGVR